MIMNTYDHGIMQMYIDLAASELIRWLCYKSPNFLLTGGYISSITKNSSTTMLCFTLFEIQFNFEPSRETKKV